MATKLKVKVINPDHLVFEGEATIVYVPGVKGTLGILPDHTPMFAEVTEGEIIVQGEQEEIVAVESGILRVQNNELLILITT